MTDYIIPSNELQIYYKEHIKMLSDAFNSAVLYQKVCYDLVDEGIITGIDLTQRLMKKEREETK